MLFILIKNELIKLMKKSKTWIVFGLFAAVIGITMFAQYNQDKNFREWNTPQKKLEVAKEELEYTNSELQNIDNNTNQNPEYIQYLEDRRIQLQEEIKIYENQIKNGIDEDLWKLQLEQSIKDSEYNIEEYKNYDDEWSKRFLLEEQENLEMLKYLKENNIKPLEGWEYEAYNYMKKLIEFLGMAILLCGIAVFMSDIVSGECTPATLKFLLIQPVSRGKVLLSKFIAVTLTVLTMIIGGELIGFSIINLTSNLSANNYPVTIGTMFNKVINSDGSIELVKVASSGYMATNSELFIKALLFQVLFIIAACAFIFMISTLIKSSMITMAVSVVVTVFLSILSINFESLKKYAHLFFVNYGDAIKILTGNSAIMYNNANMNLITGIVVLISTAIIAYIIAYFNFKNKDILI